MKHDLLIAGGTVVDGTGGARYVADLAVRDGKISGIGNDLGTAATRVDARGLFVTPGFIDVHTHYDGQVIWDESLAPIVWHGVSTAVIGNCGVGFAPARPKDRDYLIALMSSVEDIPAEALAEGIHWSWESYPEFLTAVGSRPRTIDIASMITHCSLRIYVMGERASQEPTPAEIAAMADLVREAVRCGAVGLSTSRTILHTVHGSPVPGTHASEAELTALAIAVREGGGGVRGVLEVSPPGVAFAEPRDLVEDIELLIRVAKLSGCPVVFSLLQSNHKPEDYQAVLARVGAAQQDGIAIHPEVSTRPVATLISFQSQFHPFANLPSFSSIKDLDFEQRLSALRTPALRARLINEINPHPTGLDLVFTSEGFWSQVFITGSPFNYYPKAEDSIQAIADAAAVDPRAVAYDAMLERDGRSFLLYATCNWASRNRTPLHDMMTHPSSILGLGDGGAHVTVAGDFSQPTTLLTSWVRDASPADGYRLTLEDAIHKLSLNNARVFGLHDRGALKVGLKADINLIDLDSLTIDDPLMANDLPLGLPRLEQRASGYVATYVGGVRIQDHGRLTGKLPGALARGNI